MLFMHEIDHVHRPHMVMARKMGEMAGHRYVALDLC